MIDSAELVAFSALKARPRMQSKVEGWKDKIKQIQEATMNL